MFSIAEPVAQDEYTTELYANVRPPDWQNPEPANRYNLVVIGGGSAGLVAAAGAAGLGGKVALIERNLLGGDCLNVGCVPSKSIIRSARVMGEIQRASSFGIDVPPGAKADFGRVMQRMRQVRAQISPHDSAQRFKDMGVDVFFAEGRFTGPDQVEVDGKTLRFTKALIATGSRPMHLPIPGLGEAGYLTNETVFSLTELPRRLAIIGAGPIGCELAQAFQRLGSQVTLLEVFPRILIREDEDAAKIVANALNNDGITTLLGVKIQEVTAENGEKRLSYEQDGRTGEVFVDEILVAAGRVPNIESLNLDAAGVEAHRKGISVNSYLQTTNPNIYAAGDVALKYQFTHTADASARVVLQNALFPGPKQSFDRLVIPWSTYTDPEIAHVGLYEQDAAERNIPVDTLVAPLAKTDRAVADGDTEGFVKVHIKKGSDKILGATIVASHAGEMIGEVALAITAGVGLKTLAQTIHPYPTQAAAIKQIADAYNRTRLTPLAYKVTSTWLRWTRR